MDEAGRLHLCCSRLPRANHQPGHMLLRDPFQFLKRDLSQISQHGLVSLSCVLSVELRWWIQPVGRTLRTLQCHLLEVICSNLGSLNRWALSILDVGTSLAVIVEDERLPLFIYSALIFSVPPSFLPSTYVSSWLCFLPLDLLTPFNLLPEK